MSPRVFRFALPLAFLLPGSALADRGAEIARVHLAALGGHARIEALGSVRIFGRAITGDREVWFTLVAARPNRLRLETQFPNRTIIQGWDGVAAPWELDPLKSARADAMPAATAALFVLDADFDDPLVRAGAGGGVEFAGESVVNGRPMLRLLVPRGVKENIFVLLDAQTFLIHSRGHQLRGAAGAMEIVTRYNDYRPIAGVLFAHEVTLLVNGQEKQRTKFERIEPNVVVLAEMFIRPTEPMAQR
jgi:hypothetical protein